MKTKYSLKATGNGNFQLVAHFEKGETKILNWSDLTAAQKWTYLCLRNREKIRQ